ncbi:MAG: PBP1A family penicillin-binding protein [Anaerolineae bacterium]|jgi:1A family penicillin-binding protein|nr:PBP1A family penicillin-binding protein [Anaerolineae bacterium]
MRAFAVRVLRSRRFWLGLVGLLVAIVVGLALWLLPDLPDLNQLGDGLKRPSTRIFDRHGALLYEILSPTEGRNTPVAIADIPPHCRAAVIATEDANFYTHPGVDPVGVLRALWINLRGGEVVAGGSTITQQTARMVFLDPLDRSLKRKLQEMILAVRLETAYSKDEVLALYLNQAYFGSLAYGIEAAARAYFGKSASALSVAECALLAGVLQAPALYDPLTNPDAARERQGVALRLMFERGDLTAAEAARALDEPLAFAAAPFPIQAPHFVMAVWTQLARDYPDRLYRDGLDVYTTLDLSWQQAAERVARQQLFFLNDPNQTERTPVGADSAALVALDPHTGEVLAMLGSPNYFDADISGAVNGTLALRQPGSTLKPFTYAAAMDPDRPNPWTAATITQDVVTAFTTRKGELYVPTNFGNVEHGPVTVREALASSYNIPAVAALEAVGVRSMVDLAARAGMTSLWDNPDLDLAVTLGGGEVRLLDLTQAYAVFANGGYRVAPVMITRVAVRGQETLYEWTPPALTERLIDPRVGWLITDMLADDVARTNGFGRGSLLNIGRPAAAKTGTTTDSRDNWVVGYTPSVVVGVWVGNPDNRAMVNATGLTGAGPIWHHFIRQVLAGTPPEPFPQPDGLVRVDICLPSGLLATIDCPTRRAEWFIPGTQPTETLARGIDGVRVVSPLPGAVYQLSAGLPHDAQRIRLGLEAPPDAVQTEYLINGEVVSESVQGWWALVPGNYVAVGRVTLPDGSTVESAPVHFSVLDIEGE